MLLIFAHHADWAAHALVGRWAAHDARLVTPRALSAPGWSYQPGAVALSRLALHGEVIDAADIAGVITRIPAVTPQDLPHIAPQDQVYVASEMNAFLLAWLTELPCPVVNRPTPFCLTGPAWRRERWVHTAAKLGIPVICHARATSTTLGTAIPLGLEGAPVVLVGQRCVGAADSIVEERTRRLANAAGVEALVAFFDSTGAGARFLGADLLLPYTENVADALLACLTSGSRTT